MTCLLVDIGNSRLKWASLSGGIMTPPAAVVHRDQDLVTLLDQAWGGLDAPSRVHGACVISEVRRQVVADWVRHHWACPLSWAVSQSEALGVRNGYDEPTQLGVDRWLALIGAWRRTQSAACVVDCGSAVTLDILDTSGQHLGGWIAPGMALMRAALQVGTELPLVRGSSSGEPGRNTHDAILAGSLKAVAGLIEQGMRHAPETARLLLTGGDAAQVASQLHYPYEICSDLVLEGLAGTLEGA
jgi:type III pantothenate kinase